MPVTVQATCWACHQSKARSEFPNHRTVEGKLLWSVYCRDCLTADPSLWDDVDDDDEPRESEQEPHEPQG